MPQLHVEWMITYLKDICQTTNKPIHNLSGWANKHFQTSSEVVVSMLLSELWPGLMWQFCSSLRLCFFLPLSNAHSCKHTHSQPHTDPLTLHTHTNMHTHTHSTTTCTSLQGFPAVDIYITSSCRTLVVHWQGNVPVTSKQCIINSNTDQVKCLSRNSTVYLHSCSCLVSHLQLFGLFAGFSICIYVPCLLYVLLLRPRWILFDGTIQWRHAKSS